MDEKLKELVEWLNARTLEYNAGSPTVSDSEWDKKYFELVALELFTNQKLENSPTQRIIAEVDSLKKVEHNHKMLSLEKTKDIEVIRNFVGNKPFLAMCKMDGLTCSLKYRHGQLVSAETRGNGTIGEDIYHNALVIPNIPNNILYEDELVIDGEIICTYENFEAAKEEYANVRNYASGSIRLLNSTECAARHLTFVVWDVITGMNDVPMLDDRLAAATKLGFTVVPSITAEPSMIERLPPLLASFAKAKSYPIDGIVFKFNDIAYGKTLGETSHHFKNAMAFKFYDETYPTSLKNIEWSLGRTGVLTPIAIFDPVDDGESIIERASIHNISVMKELLGKPYSGQTLEVFKANQIIPQIASAGTPESAADIEGIAFEIPSVCPVCGQPTEILNNTGVEILVCSNELCEGKLLNVLEHFCGKKGLDIKGISKATLEKLIDWEWVLKREDIFELKMRRPEWIKKPGFGVASVDKVLAAIEAARTTTDTAFIASLGIPLIGNSVAKDLMKHFQSYRDLREAIEEKYDFSKIDGFAEAKTLALWNYDYTEADNIYDNYMNVIKEEKIENTNNSCKDLKFVITGKLTSYKKRDDLKKIIEELGGKVTDSVTKATSYLINNDINSTTGKNQTAKKLEVPIITEEEFIKKFVKIS